MNSGTATLHAALEACGVGYGDEVISPALTVIMDTTATFHANAIPVYADIDPHTLNIDPVDIERKITPKTKAIIVVNLYGLPADLPKIMEIAAKHNLYVIEDNAQCYQGTINGKLAGTFGHIASYSLENSKHISCGEGGLVTTNDAELAKRMRKIGGHGFKNLEAADGMVRRRSEVFQHPDYKRHDTVGWNYRLSEFLGAVGCAQLERLNEFVILRQIVADMFLKTMEACHWLAPQYCPKGYVNSYYTLAVKYNGPIPWAEFRAKYVEMGGDGIYGAWSVPYLEPMMTERQYANRLPIYNDLVYSPGLCPVAESVQPKIMQFKTNYRDMSEAKRQADILQKLIGLL